MQYKINDKVELEYFGKKYTGNIKAVYNCEKGSKMYDVEIDKNHVLYVSDKMLSKSNTSNIITDKQEINKELLRSNEELLFKIELLNKEIKRQEKFIDILINMNKLQTKDK